MTFVPSQCLACQRLRRAEIPEGIPPGDRDGVETCDAFPDGIPGAIALGRDHRFPVGGEQSGLLFSPRVDSEGVAAYGAWQRTFGDGDVSTA